MRKSVFMPQTSRAPMLARPGMSALERRRGRLLRDPNGHDEAAAAEAAAAKAAADKAAADKAAADAAAAAAAAAEAGTTAADEAIAAAKAEADRLKAELAKFDGIDPAVAKANADKLAAAEVAQREAEKAKATAEGNFEKLREIQNEEHQAALKAANEAKEAAEKRATDVLTQLNNERVKTAFGNSKFLADETILSPSKAQRLFVDHVEFENGQVVVYDAPKDAAKRAKIMDAKGNPLDFDTAIKKVVEADPDKDTLLKSKVKPGANSKTDAAKPTIEQDRHSKLSAGIAKLRGVS